MAGIGTAARVTAFCVLLPACASVEGYPDRPENVDAKIGKLQELYFLPGRDVLSLYAGKSGADRRSFRDEVVYGQLQAFDIRFAEFTEALYKEGITTNLGLDLLGLGVGAAGATVTGATASRVLSAMSTGVAGTQTAINKTLYYERTMPALLALMVAERQKIRADIEQGLSLSDDDYPLGKALVDVERYYLAGSLPGAVTAVTQNAGQTKLEADARLTTVRNAAFTDARAQKQVIDLIRSVDSLPAGKAYELLTKPPAPLDDYVRAAIASRSGGALGSAAADRVLKGAANDPNAKAILKMALKLVEDRSPEALAKWRAAIVAEANG